jgi:hypothetical protein
VVESKSISPITLSILLCFAAVSVFAQDRCGTVQYIKKQRSQAVLLQSDQQFEDWIIRKGNISPNFRSRAEPYKIPVVVHLIHNGEPVGTGANISDAQILSQINVLNEDFRRENADASNTLPIFSPVASGMDIEFVLAKRDPEGKATDGIVRINGNKANWSSNDNYELKSLSYWPAEDYMNLWVCNITDFLGYSQFPVSDLPGLENSSNNSLTDGVVLWHRAFGSSNDGNFDLDPAYDKGRTATHEISHFFGLRHIWGDDNNECTGTDYVDDTPNQGGFTSGCPSSAATSCGAANMFQNFQDYTDDECMNMFTQGQIERMRIVIDNSPRRKSLLTSPGLLPPDPVANDLGISDVISPLTTQCSNTVSPVIEVKNYGTNTITSARLRLKINGTTIETKDVSLSMAPSQVTNISFSPIAVSTGSNTITFEILLTNGLVDGDPKSNENTVTRELHVPATIALPFTEGFSSIPSDWIISNPDQQITWELAEAPNQNQNNTALRMRFFDYENNFGEQDILYSPVFDLSDATSAVLFFDIAHARYDFSGDRLKVIAITNCADISNGTVIYDSAGIDLATVPGTHSFYIPSGTVDWEREIVALDQFIGHSFVQLAFIGINDYGNNLYLDNISVFTEALNDVSVKKIVSPSLVTCNETNAPVVLVQNTGTEPVNSIEISFGTSETTLQSTTLSDLDIQPGNEVQLTLPQVSFGEGENQLIVSVGLVNGAADDNEFNNVIETKVVVNPATDRIPLRQTFERPFEDSWTNVSTDDGMVWETIPTNYGTSIYFNAFNNTAIGDEAWLVTPVLDFSRALEASMLFDVSYMGGVSDAEDLKVMISRNCGDTYELLDFTLPEPEPSPGSWAPQDEDDWTNHYLNLSEFAGESQIRIAFVIRNVNGNNLYLDNIEFFVTDNPKDITIDTQYSIFGYDLGEISNSDLKVGFNLTERQDVTCHILDTMGKTVSETKWTDVLNQVFDLPIHDGMTSGIYIVRLGINHTFFGTRIYISR